MNPHTINRYATKIRKLKQNRRTTKMLRPTQVTQHQNRRPGASTSRYDPDPYKVIAIKLPQEEVLKYGNEMPTIQSHHQSSTYAASSHTISAGSAWGRHLHIRQHNACNPTYPTTTTPTSWHTTAPPKTEVPKWTSGSQHQSKPTKRTTQQKSTKTLQPTQWTVDIKQTGKTRTKEEEKKSNRDGT